MFGEKVGQFDVQCLGDGEDAAQFGVWGVSGSIPLFQASSR